VPTSARSRSHFALRGSFAPGVALAALTALVLVPSCSRRGGRDAEETTGAEEVVEAVAPRQLVGALALDPEILQRVRTLSDVEALCVEGSNELCNAIDEDCDGRIDEGGCPYRAGDVQVTMTWNNGSDIDLFVREPDGDVLSHQRSTSARGGLFDYAGRGQCDSAIEYPRIENVSWLREDAPEGEYQLLLHRWGDCLDRATETQDAVSVILSISVAGVRLGTFQVELGPQERFEGIRFRVTAP